ncbi:hypothetical protein BDK51DRAFT_51479 [Blyttiomyces helicus]|uniref:Uncharacterized protein n=1 Tax=Blyttiomyces helicus TaxID=388810 RepID=A0A4P9WPJ2_9FUNG|nr:hypothetical protein BDK51DRAFT_51479 [Blyttiomyces helicus]|eukprot:RKO93170.1 hypothetical protein BDK51DRAFT_51479 [Blyttiomyces helicus]
MEGASASSASLSPSSPPDVGRRSPRDLDSHRLHARVPLLEPCRLSNAVFICEALAEFERLASSRGFGGNHFAGVTGHCPSSPPLPPPAARISARLSSAPGFPGLSRLSLKSCSKYDITDAIGLELVQWTAPSSAFSRNVKAAEKLPRLKILLGSFLDDGSLAAYSAKCSLLVKVDLHNSKITDAGVKELLVRCKTLESPVPAPAQRQTPPAHLHRLHPRLPLLEPPSAFKLFGRTPPFAPARRSRTPLMTDPAYSAKCSLLVKVDLRKSKVTDAGVKDLLSGCKIIKDRDLTSTAVTATTFIALVDYHPLTFLGVGESLPTFRAWRKHRAA